MSYKTRFLTIAGILWTVGFAYRYLILYLDKSQAITFISVGVGILFVAWTVDKLERIRGTIDNIDDRMEEIIKYEKD